jgi:hypothetical protein
MGTISAVWDLYHSVQQTQTCNGRRMAAKFVINRHHSTSSVSFMIEKLDWKSLENWEKHLARLTIIMYKLANEMVKVNKSMSHSIRQWNTWNTMTKGFQVCIKEQTSPLNTQH